MKQATTNEIYELVELAQVFENFVKLILQAEPTNQQLDAIRAIDAGEKRIGIKSGHGTGKSSLLAWAALWAGCTKYDCKIPITAPSAPQLQSIIMPEIRKWNNKMPSFLKDSVTPKRDKVTFENTNFVAIRTARKEEPEALQGFHATNLMFLVDEASGVPENIFEVIDGALTGEHNILLMTGNPTRTSGYFFNAFHKNRELWKLLTFNAEASSNVSPGVIARRRREFGYDSDIYRVRVLGEFPRASSDALFSVESLDEAVSREDYDRTGSFVWGLDVARFGDDSTVLCERQGYMIKPLELRKNLDTMEIASWVAYEYNSALIKPSLIYVDSIGVGGGVLDRLIQLNIPAVSADVTKSSARKEYKNKRIEMYMTLRDKLPYLKLPDDDELLGELSSMKYIYTEGGQMALEPKKEMKERFGRSPDKADALALTFFNPVFYDDIEEERGQYRAPTMGNVDGVAW